MKISVVTPMLNEIRFVKGWLDNVRKFADEIIVVDMKSTDGTWEYLDSQLDVDLLSWWRGEYKPYEWPEHKIRNELIRKSTGDYIVPLDADELVCHFFIDYVKSGKLEEALIHRFLQIAPWGEYKTLRKRSLKPLKENHNGTIRWLRNWRGHYPSWTPRAFKNDKWIFYSETGNHCHLQWRGLGRFSYHVPGVTKTHEHIPFYHMHYLTRKDGNGRDGETEFETLNCPYTYPKEIELYNL